MDFDYSEKACMKRALMRLNIGDMTAMGMYRYLTEKRPEREPFPDEIAQKVVRKLMAQDFINDKRFLLIFLEKLDLRKLGPRKIRDELIKRGFSSRIIEKALMREIDYKSRAVELLEKKKNSMLFDESRENVSKLVKFLVSQGYDYMTAFAAVEETIKNKIYEE